MSRVERRGGRWRPVAQQSVSALLGKVLMPSSNHRAADTNHPCRRIRSESMGTRARAFNGTVTGRTGVAAAARGFDLDQCGLPFAP